METLKLTPNVKEEILISCPHTFVIKAGDKLLKYQEHSPWVIISLIFITSGVEKALTLKGEI